MKDRKLSIDFNINRIQKKFPLNSEILISNTRYNDKYYLKEVKLEQFVESYDEILGNYYLVILHIQTNNGDVLMKFDEGYRKNYSFELMIELIKKYEGFSSLINRAIIELEV
jgi:hypothetical protein